ncbi:MAG: Transposase Tn5 dimerization domain [Planctomycetaceae bacterium]|nr:Transposase Tn5 dimerization domain [Planctomycetaceae bacterium]
MLNRTRNTPIDPEMTIYDFLRKLADFGCFLGRKGDGEPGCVTVWRGFEILLLMLMLMLRSKG